MTCDDEIEYMGTGWFHIMAVIICGLGNAADAVELLCISYIIPELDKEDETVTDHAKSKQRKSYSLLFARRCQPFR